MEFRNEIEKYLTTEIKVKFGGMLREVIVAESPVVDTEIKILKISKMKIKC